MAKLRWVEIDGMKYVEQYEDDHHHCRCCVFNDHELDKYCRQVDCSDEIIFVPLEPQHIPNLRVKGKTKWLS